MILPNTKKAVVSCIDQEAVAWAARLFRIRYVSL